MIAESFCWSRRSGHSRSPTSFPPLWESDSKTPGKSEEEVEIEKSNVLLLGPTGRPAMVASWASSAAFA